MRILLTGGGTGGHVVPQLALLAALEPKLEVHYLGSAQGIERTWLSSRVNYHVIPSAKWRRYFSLTNLLTPFVVLWAVVVAWQIIRQLRPRVIFSTGGYVALPVVWAGFLARVPIVIHEQTRVMGLSNRIASWVADRILLGFPPVATGKHATRAVVVGNPVRAELFVSTSPAAAKQELGFDPVFPLVVVMGGAQGCHFFNSTLMGDLPEWISMAQILIVSGVNADFAALLAAREGLPPDMRRRLQVVEYLGETLGMVYLAADLVIARAGAGTVSELLALGTRALLVPLPASAGGEQQANAAYAAEQGRITVLEQEQAKGGNLLQAARQILASPPSPSEPRSDSSVMAPAEPIQRILTHLAPYLK